MLAISEDRVGGALAGMLATLRRHAVLLRNSTAMFLGAAGASVLGVAFWWVAARGFPPDEVGTGAALIAVMGLLGLFGEIGLGTVLLGAPPAARRGGLVAAALLAACGASALLGIGFLGIGLTWPRLLQGLDGFDSKGLLLVLGTALTGVTLAADQALIGRLQAELQLLRNLANSVTKLAALAAAAAAGATDGALILLSCWVLGQAGSLLLVGALAARRDAVGGAKPDFSLLRSVLGRGVEHHALNIAAQAPTIVFPFLVAVLFSPAVNAAFYPAWAVVHAVTLFPAALTTVLYRVGTEEPHRLSHRLSFSLRLSALFSLAAAAGLFLLSRHILGFFNPAYPDLAGSGLAMLGFGIASLAVRQHYLALMRLRNRMRQAAVQFALWSAAEIGAACLGAGLGGLDGFVIGWLLAISAQAAAMLPALLSAMRRHGEDAAGVLPPGFQAPTPSGRGADAG